MGTVSNSGEIVADTGRDGVRLAQGGAVANLGCMPVVETLEGIFVGAVATSLSGLVRSNCFRVHQASFGHGARSKPGD